MARQEAIEAFRKFTEASTIFVERTPLWDDYVVKREVFLFELANVSGKKYFPLEPTQIEHKESRPQNHAIH